MTATATAIPHVRTARSAVIPASLDALLALDVPALARLYAEAEVPRLDDVRGDLRGRMLATTVLKGRVAEGVRAIASSNSFPWRGKSFLPRSATTSHGVRGLHEKSAARGDGINRVILDRWRLFRFETFIARSRAGDFDALQLDYDNTDNPFFIRPIKDEMRELSRGLWLGQAYLELKGKANLVLYFGLAR